MKYPKNVLLPPDQPHDPWFRVETDSGSRFDVPQIEAIEADEKLDWLWKGRIPRGHVTLIDGPPKAGKSFVVLDLVARLSSDSPWPDGTGPFTIDAPLPANPAATDA